MLKWFREFPINERATFCITIIVVALTAVAGIYYAFCYTSRHKRECQVTPSAGIPLVVTAAPPVGAIGGGVS